MPGVKLKISICLTELLSWVLLPMIWLRRNGRVLHISYDVHVAFYTVKILRDNGIKADYLAIDQPGKWHADYYFPLSYGHVSAKERWREFFFFWRVVSRYKILHSHFMMTLSQSAWEMKFFKLAGGKWVVHGRGCAERDRDRNIQLHPKMNICQDCDYNSRICTDPLNKFRRKLIVKQADKIFVTTPDMLDFMPDAEHIPFFFPPIPLPSIDRNKEKDAPFRIVHVTNHPGIEGTRYIEGAINSLIAKGYNIEFVFLTKMANDEVLKHYEKADLTIGKMKMGYYANAQVESLYYGVPAITYIRKEFVTPELEASGLILSDLERLEQTIRYYIDHPEALHQKRALCQSSVMTLHNNKQIALRYKDTYDTLRKN